METDSANTYTIKTPLEEPFYVQLYEPYRYFYKEDKDTYIGIEEILSDNIELKVNTAYESLRYQLIPLFMNFMGFEGKNSQAINL